MHVVLVRLLAWMQWYTVFYTFMSMCVYMSVMCLYIEPRILPSVEDGADGLPRARQLILAACLDPCVPTQGTNPNALLSLPATHSAEHTGGWRPAEAWSIELKVRQLGHVCECCRVHGLVREWHVHACLFSVTNCGLKHQQLLTPEKDAKPKMRAHGRFLIDYSQ